MMPINEKEPANWYRLMPGTFVFLWSTGFIGAKYGLPYAEPFTFLLYRFVIVLVVLIVAAFGLKATWPRQPIVVLHCLVSGILLHGVYLGGVFGSIAFGMPAGITALIVGLQPLLTAVLSRPLLGETVSKTQWIGLFMGLMGVGIVLGPRLMPSTGHVLNVLNVSLSIAALMGMTLGTIYQKRFVASQDLRTSGVWQFAGAALLVGTGAYFFETMHIEWTPQFIGAMAWLVIILSLGAMSLLILIIRHGTVSRIATLFYLVPPVTALIAFLAFDERLSIVQLIGMIITAYAVWFAGRQRR